MRHPFSDGPEGRGFRCRVPDQVRTSGPSFNAIRLGYSQRPPAYRRVGFHRLLTVAAVVAVGATARVWLPPLLVRARLLHAQRRCLAYDGPAGQAVVDFTRRPGPAGIVPGEWASFYGLLSPPGQLSSGTVFLHERHVSGGPSRLVAVDLTGGGAGGGHCVISAQCRVIVPGNVARTPTEATPAGWAICPDWYSQDLQVMAGTADPTDPSHFTFGTVEAGIPVTYDGWLRDDDSVAIEVRLPKRPPTPAPPPGTRPRTVAP